MTKRKVEMLFHPQRISTIVRQKVGKCRVELARRARRVERSFTSRLARAFDLNSRKRHPEKTMDRELENQGMNERPAQDTLTVRVRAHDPRGEHVVKVARNVRRARREARTTSNGNTLSTNTSSLVSFVEVNRVRASFLDD